MLLREFGELSVLVLVVLPFLVAWLVLQLGIILWLAYLVLLDFMDYLLEVLS